MALSTYGDISQRTAAWAATQALEHAEPIIVLGKFGDSKPVPANTANTVKFRRPVPFDISTTPLTEGVTPPSHGISYEDVSAQLYQYGDVAEITDHVNDMAEDPVLSDMMMLSGEQAAETTEMVTYGVIKAGTSVYYANGTARTDVNTAVSLALLRNAVRYVRKMRGRPVTSMLAPSPNYGTAGIEGGYIAFLHTDLVADLRALTGWTPVVEYGSRKPLCPEEVGAIEDVRFIASPLLTPWADGGGAKAGSGTTMLSTSGTSADVYPIMLIAQHAYGLVALKGANAIKPMVLNPGVPRGGDPLGQRGTVGWKTYHAAVRLNETWLVRLECAARATPT